MKNQKETENMRKYGRKSKTERLDSEVSKSI